MMRAAKWNKGVPFLHQLSMLDLQICGSPKLTEARPFGQGISALRALTGLRLGFSGCPSLLSAWQRFPETKLAVANVDTVTASLVLNNACALNFANAVRPGLTMCCLRKAVLLTRDLLAVREPGSYNLLLFAQQLASPDFRGAFDAVVFAIIDPRGDGNLRPFREVLQTLGERSEINMCTESFRDDAG
ncbi:hypothetical protein AK812_SmicGene26575 [Symbiodinium microadriaticum]|uniref:Uncharacterized protein n=1 Tax=Symbiodinium microadriaticum TaxID=2951 RepID=A0A1Q9D925_SYMMI|nr:hypothetical protein AK812_SmicGene26575 [Symbiodinium microadriaticum]